MRIGLVQLSVGPDPTANLQVTEELIKNCAQDRATWIFTPEVTNLLETRSELQEQKLQAQDEDVTLRAISALAKALDVSVTIGSLALRTADADGRYANRSFHIGSDGQIVAQYDKIHMFDVVLSDTEKFMESSRYRPGSKAVVVDAPLNLGMSVCYDLRFPHLYRMLAKSGAEVLSVPAAFAQTTGEAHWHVLLRARAIETGCFVVAAAQTGKHGNGNHALRKTYGHSLVVDPWGHVLLDMGTEPGHAVVEIDPAAVGIARNRVPAITSDREFDAP